MLNTFLTSILYFILLNRTHYQFYKNAPTASFVEVGHWLCNEDSLLQAWVGTYDKTWTSDIWLLLIFCEGRVPWTIFSQLERLMRSSHTRQPGVAEDIERWCGLSSSPVVVVLLTNTQWWLTRARWWWLMLLRLLKPLHAVKLLLPMHWWSVAITSAWHNESEVL